MNEIEKNIDKQNVSVLELNVRPKGHQSVFG
jgi:hypothetical protein